MSTQHIRYPDDGILTVPTVADLPPVAADGTLAVVTGTDSVYIFDFPTLTWLLVGTGGGGAVNSVNAGTNTQITGPATDPIVNAGTESWQFTGVITTPILNNFINDWNPSGLSTATVIRVFGDLFDPPVFTGLQGGGSGRVIIIHNASQDTPIYFGHDDPLSSAGNRFYFAGFGPHTYWPLPINGVLILQYDESDSVWRILGKNVFKVSDDGGGVISVGGDEAFPIVGFNGVFTDGVTITGNGTAFFPLTGTPALDVLVNNTVYVDPFYGDDGTAIPNSMVLKYQTIDAALTAISGFSDYTVYLLPGNHNMTNPFNVTNSLNIYISEGAKLQTNTITTSFLVDPGIQLRIHGDGWIERTAILAANSSSGSSVPCEVYISGVNIESSGANPILEVTSMIYSIEYNGIFDSYVEGQGWSRGSISCDLWRTSSYIFRLLNFTASSGEIKYSDYGPQTLTIKGRTKPNCLIVNEVACGNAMYLEAGVESYKTIINLHADFDSQDGFFFNHGRGIVNWYSNLYHSKSDLAGNEVPWYICDQSIEDDTLRPVLRHYGVAVSTTHPAFAGSQNNEIFYIQTPTIIELNGKYENSGFDSGLGPWPIVKFSPNLGAGESVIKLNGEFKSNGGDVAPISILSAGGSNPSHTPRLEVKNSTIRTLYDYCIDTDYDNLNIWTYYSLNANRNYHPNIIEGFSEDRTIIDDNVQVDVPEYGI